MSAPLRRQSDGSAIRLAEAFVLALFAILQPPAHAGDEERTPVAAAGGAQNGEISWLIPAEGGTPRAASRIESVGPMEFRIRASFEEGGESVLRHAVSRMELICLNRGTEPAQVTVHLDLSDDGKRTDYDSRPEAGMKTRDFIFIQPPSEGWQQVQGVTDRWVATVTFRAAPGETKVGLSPWYGYGDLLRWLGSLPQHPHLVKRQAGKSDGGRDHWELVVTDT